MGGTIERREMSLDHRAFQRRLFRAAAVLFPLIVLAGFARTYYLKVLTGAPALPSTMVHVHGLLMTAWVVLFVTQVALVSSRQIRLHQRLGYTGIGLAAAIIITGVPVALRSGKFGSAASPPGIPPLAFMIVPVFDLLMFAGFFGAAVYYRRQAAAHRSLMLLTALNFLPPALGRMPFASVQALGPLFFFGVPTAFALAVLVLGRRQHGRIDRVLAWGTGALVASYVVRLALMMTGPWLSFAAWLTTFV